jgi:hypothetical protein
LQIAVLPEEVIRHLLRHGTYEVLHPKGASIELTRSLFEGHVSPITSVRNTPDPALEKARRIRLYDENKRNLMQYISLSQPAALRAMSIYP